LREEIAKINSEAILCDGFDDAIIGIGERVNLGPVVAYDIEKIISILVNRDGMTDEEAWEFYYFNIVGGWYGEFTPIFISKIQL
jgi:uncharacterized membrane protein YedE/YeeE